jgi:hypothetical protein
MTDDSRKMLEKAKGWGTPADLGPDARAGDRHFIEVTCRNDTERQFIVNGLVRTEDFFEGKIYYADDKSDPNADFDFATVGTAVAEERRARP